MALVVVVRLVGKLTLKNKLGIKICLCALRVEVTVIVENEVRGVVEGLRLTVRYTPPLEVIAGEPTDTNARVVITIVIATSAWPRDSFIDCVATIYLAAG
jgi:hypothetical protein